MGTKFGGQRQPAACFRAFRRARFHAGHDGHDSEPRTERSNGRHRRGEERERRFAWDCYRRFIQMYGDVVMGVQKRPDEDHEPFETVIDDLKTSDHGNHRLPGHPAQHRRSPGTGYALQEACSRSAPARFPHDPWDQLWGAIGAVFGSWMNDRAIVYRRKYNIPARMGHGRQRSGHGLWQHWERLRLRRRLHARSGHRREGVLRRISDQRPGRRRRGRRSHAGAGRQLKKEMPKAYQRTGRSASTLEKHFKDVQDFEFTIQEGKLFMLQTRNGKRTGAGRVRSPWTW